MHARPLAVSLAGAALAIVAAVSVALARQHREPRPASSAGGLTFCASQGDSPRAESSWSYPLINALLLAVPLKDSETLAVALDEANRRWETRANPFTEDLEDTDPDESLARWLEHAPPAAATALAASHDRYCGADRWCVRVVAAASTCPTGFTRVAEDSPEIGRARFLAWPFGHAVWMRAETKEAAQEAARALRSRAVGTSYAALVFHSNDDVETREASPRLRAGLFRHEVLRRAAAIRAGNVEGPPPVLRVGGDGASETEGFPLKLGELDVVIVPRLDATRDPLAFEAELREAAPKLRVVN